MPNTTSPPFHEKCGKMFGGLKELANDQTDAQDEVVSIINDMCDSLESACDLMVLETSQAIADLNRARSRGPDDLRAAFGKTALRFSGTELLKKLKTGKVCGDLKKLGRRFGNPLSKQTRSSITAQQWLMTFYRRSNSMKRFVEDLYFDERRYLEDFRKILGNVRKYAENSVAIDNEKTLQKRAETLRQGLQKSREVLRSSIDTLRNTADQVIDSIH